VFSLVIMTEPYASHDASEIEQNKQSVTLELVEEGSPPARTWAAACLLRDLRTGIQFACASHLCSVVPMQRTLLFVVISTHTLTYTHTGGGIELYAQGH